MEWVMASERLPMEANGSVLVCYSDKRVSTARYSEYSQTWYKGDLCGVGGDDPIAWMPLPEPVAAKRE